mmetsp:Transcript_84238/g.149234  ORF Transcript_84238/g.149234 Transcript_84238/m.149234 type:complete len:308 (+) Transcript_84238:78-1001(+)
MAPLDYSKFDKIADSEEEENYDDYLRERYGVTSEWRPGCGMQPPVLGGRTPGKMYEDHEMEPLGNLEFSPQDENDTAEEHAAEEPAQSATPNGGRWLWYLFGTLRAVEALAWLLPTLFCVHVALIATEDVKIEMAVYPVTIALTFLLGLFDAVLAAIGATRGEGRGAVAFACWFKRFFLAMSFLAYEAQFTSEGALLLGRVPLRLLSGLVMILIWTVRKLYSYAQDIRDILKGAETPSSLLPGGRRLLIVEALAEAVFALVHIALLPRGVKFLGHGDGNIMLICTGACLSVCSSVALAFSRQALKQD